MSQTQSRCTFCRCTGHQIRQCEDPRVQIIENSIQTLIQDNEDFLSFDTTPSRAIMEAFFDDIHDLGTIKMYCILLNLSINQSILLMRRDLVDMLVFQREMQSNQRNRNVTIRQQEGQRTQKRTVILHLHDQIQNLQTDLTVQIYARNEEETEENMEITFRNEVQSTLTQMHDKIQEIRNHMVEYCDLFGRPAYQNLTRIMSMSGDVSHYRLDSHRMSEQFHPPPYEIKKQTLKQGEEWSAIECPVCYEDIVPDKVYMTPCQHKFCSGCITHALKTKLSCPLCRENVSYLTVKLSVS
jgi:rubrerythrin